MKNLRLEAVEGELFEVGSRELEDGRTMECRVNKPEGEIPKKMAPFRVPFSRMCGPS
ncbi:hypothetical protein [Maribellus mangrovi]|uniref:hypothetical protein n=1 Tax=Maribellus mangrovi TaxID=3133146 RepID=UPI0030ED5937